MQINGIGASAGIAIGSVLKIEPPILNISDDKITDIISEIAKFSKAIAESKNEISKVKEITIQKFGHEKGEIFEAHELILEDPEVQTQVVELIKNSSVNASWAVNKVLNDFVSIFESMDDPYMQERAADLKDVFNRVLNHLEGNEVVDLSTIDKDVILVTDDLTPSQAAMMDKDHVLGFLTDKGGKTSHTAIMARSLEIPAVVGLESITSSIDNGVAVAFNGKTGEVIISPTSTELEKYHQLQKSDTKRKLELQKLVGTKSLTTDGFSVELAGNIGSFQDLESFDKNDAESVGLYRTEFLFLDRDSMPTESEQYDEYSRIVKHLKGKSCIIRTLDIGGDKNLPYLNVGSEDNPFLGYRAIRICLDRKDIFKVQLRALLRAGVHGDVGIMFPMISDLTELEMAKSILNECKSELKSEGVNYSEDIKIGIMIEVPSAALMSDILAKHVDFFSLGTNDLTQYTCAVDRINQRISHLYNPFNPGLLRLIKLTADNAAKNNISISICGSMAHFPELIPFFIGCKISKLSMSPMHILKTKEQVLKYDSKRCEAIVDSLLNLETTEQIKNFLNNFLKEIK